MLAKVTNGNQLTLPASALEAVGKPTFFEIVVEEGRIVLTPARVVRANGDADAIRAELEALGTTEADVGAAVARARR